jgi:hypothetical protein
VNRATQYASVPSQPLRSACNTSRPELYTMERLSQVADNPKLQSTTSVCTCLYIHCSNCVGQIALHDASRQGSVRAGSCLGGRISDSSAGCTTGLLGEHLQLLWRLLNPADIRNTDYTAH